MTDLCLAAAGIVVHLAATEFTLAWTHSVERVRWEEDWRVEGDRLVAADSRVRGSGAGMDPPAAALAAYLPAAGPIDSAATLEPCPG